MNGNNFQENRGDRFCCCHCCRCCQCRRCWCRTYCRWQRWWRWQAILNNTTNREEIAAIMEEMQAYQENDDFDYAEFTNINHY